MKVMVVVKASKASEAGEMPSEQLLREMGAYNEQLVKAGIMLAGEGLHPSSKGVRVGFRGKERTVTDGPFAETKELIAGYWIWKVKSMQEAVDWLKRCPNPHEDACEVEIRPIFSAEDFGAEFTPELREQEASLRAETLGLGAIRFEDKPAHTLAGVQQRYARATAEKEIPAQWESFMKQEASVPGRVGKVSYGVSLEQDKDCNFTYMTAVEVKPDAKAPAGLQLLSLPVARYAVFTIAGDITTLPPTLEKICTQWIPDCGLKLAHAPWIERYAEDFTMESKGKVEVWLPLEA
ncbi:MAG: GyrI-like domain-containing protein [Pirellulales bacterium]